MPSVRIGQVVAVVAVVVGVTSACTGSSTPQPIASTTATGAASPPRSSQSPSSSLPAINAPGFPAAIYPAPVKGRQAVPLCPSPVGLQSPGPHMDSRAIRIASRFQTGPQLRELHAADRAIWSQIYTDKQSRKYGTAGAHRNVPVLSHGPLLGRYTGGGAPNPAVWVKRDCPPLVAERSYEVAIGPRNGPALDAVFVFVQRKSRPLLYFVYP